MPFLIISSDGIIKYTSADEPDVQEDRIVIPDGPIVCDMNADNAVVVEVETLPEGQVAGKYSYVDGEFVAIPVAQANPTEIYLHVALAGGDSLDPIGVVIGGLSPINVMATIRAGADVAAPAIPVTGSWRINIRCEDKWLYDIVKVDFIDGIAELAYVPQTGSVPAICYIDEADFEPVVVGEQTYNLKLANPVNFKVYREL